MYPKSKRYILLYTAILFLIFIDLFKYTTEFSIAIKADKSENIQLFYESFLDLEEFTEKKSEKKQLNSSNNYTQLVFNIPNISFIRRIRIDLGSGVNEYYIKNFKFKSFFLNKDLKTEEVLKYSVLNENIRKHSINNNILKINSEGSDPYFIIKNRFIVFTLLNLLITIVLSFCLLLIILAFIYWVDNFIKNYKNSKTLKLINNALDKQFINQKLFIIIVTLFFFLIAFYGSLQHEMWRDELEMYSKYSLRNYSFFSLFTNPYSFLYHSLSGSVVYVKLFHVLISTGTTFLILRYSSFSQLQKVLFVFSYFILYEYTIINRAYGFSVLLFMSTITLLTCKRIRIIPILIIILLLSKHNLYGAVLSVSVVLYILIKFNNEGRFKQFFKKHKVIKIVVISIMIIAGGGFLLKSYGIFYIQRISQVEHLLKPPLFNTLRTIWTAFIPIPEIGTKYIWDTNIIPFIHSFSSMKVIDKSFNILNIIAFIVSTGIFYFIVKVYTKKIENKFFLVTGLVILLAVYQFVGLYFIRYIGMVFILFVGFVWINKHQNQLAKTFLYFILIIQFTVGAVFYIKDIKLPFTASHQTANFIETKIDLENNLIVGRTDYLAQPISILLNKEIYFPQIDEFAIHVDWSNSKRKSWISDRELINKCMELRKKYNKDLIIIVNNLINIDSAGVENLKLLNSFENTMIESEKYFIYRYANE